MERILTLMHKLQKQGGIAILITDKGDFQSELDTNEKEDHHMLIKGINLSGTATAVNASVPKVGS